MNTGQFFFKRLVFIVAALLLGFSQTGGAGVRLPVIFSEGMVLQYGQPVRIWGWADPGERVAVSVAGVEAEAVTDADGKWETTLAPLPAGGPYTLRVNQLAVEDVMAGHVWFCSGQSNMETPVSRVTDLFADEINSYENRAIRHIKIANTPELFGPRDDIRPVEWKTLEHPHVMEYSALAYFFAREIYDATGIPVGIVNSSVGGSPIEAWLNVENIGKFPRYYNELLYCRSEEFVEAAWRLGGISNRRWRETLDSRDAGLTAVPVWSSPEADDSGWKSYDLFDRSWAAGIDGPLAGSFWLRKKITVPQEMAGKEALLRLGCIVDADYAYVNGRLVGHTSYQYPPRKYTVPEGVLRAGENVIAVRVIVNGGNGHFVPDKPYKLICGDMEINLEGDWLVTTGAPMPPMPGVISFAQKPTTLYNGMVAPIKDYTVEGVIWYQGETNSGRPNEYYGLLETLIGQYRAETSKGELPVLVVQLPNYMEPDRLPRDNGWQNLREVQLRISQDVPNVGLAVAIDAGEWNDIHPLDKKSIGRRLALQARRIAYGEDIVADGPVYWAMTADGGRLLVSFREGTDDLPDGAPVGGFAVAGADGRFHWARARVEGRQVVVWSDEVLDPVAVRYGWANNPQGANLVNRQGIPASPFRASLEK